MLSGCDSHINAPKITFHLEQNGNLKIKKYVTAYLTKSIAANKKTSAEYIAHA
jgi:hypothetical protein